MKCNKYNIHINFPGGVPVDGPSAGIAVASAIYSSIVGKKVNNYIAMTGEIGVFGGVKAIGGVKAKINGAKKAGAKTVIIPKDNWSEDLEKIEDINICTVENIKDVFKILFSIEKRNVIETNVAVAKGKLN